jgi:hypothetical protein
MKSGHFALALRIFVLVGLVALNWAMPVKAASAADCWT